MKRIITVFVVAFILALVVNACKSSEHCPAYGQAEQQQEAQNS